MTAVSWINTINPAYSCHTYTMNTIVKHLTF